MKKIFIAAADMEIGGAERSLLGLLQAIDQKEYQVDLFLLRHVGALMPLIPAGIHVLPQKTGYADLGIPIWQSVRHGHFHMVYGRLKGKIKARRFIRRHHLKKENSVAIHYSFRYTLPYLEPVSSVVYDLAIGFTVPYYIVPQKVRAKKTAVWIHTDYTMIEGDRKEEQKVWDACDHIVAVSEAVGRSFLKVFPGLKDKLFLMENILSPAMIRQQADFSSACPFEMPDQHDVMRLLSVGRLTKAKNFDNVPDICSRIIRDGWHVKWYIIGFGSDQKRIERKIREAHMEDCVILLGKKSNPYPYIKSCDIYVQPSRYEGKAVAVREAQILQKPVVITDFPTAGSQLKDGVDGCIVPLDNEGCAKGIEALLASPQKQKALSVQCAMEDFSNEAEVHKLAALL